MNLIRQLWSILLPRERWHLGVLACLLLARAGVEMVGVASVMPFLSVVAEPEIIHTNAYLAAAYEGLGFESDASFLSALGIAVVVFLLVANAVSAGAVYGMLRFSWGMHHRLSVRLLKGYLAQPYGFFVQSNSASCSKTLLTEVEQVVKGVLTPLLNLLARVLASLAIVALLVILDPWLAVLVVAVLGGGYGAIYAAVKHKQRVLGQEKVEANRIRFKVAGEAFGAIKETKVLQRERSFVKRFRPAAVDYARARASNGMISQLPRYLLETIAFGGIVLIVLYHLRAGAAVQQVVPIVGLYAFAGYRLMPELQQLFSSVTLIRFHRGALDDVIGEMDRFVKPPPRQPEKPVLPFERSIELRDVSFRHPGAAEPALTGASVKIRRHQTVGLVGPSGSGKTTLADLLLGLYEPEGGQILVDGVPLDETTMSSWRERLGYVPQHIFLSDDSVAANIALGIPSDEIDIGRVERAARIAQLHEFVLGLPAGYETVVGERGVRFSGGQRQRVGIARALYHESDVLVLDEATSALDGATEGFVMQAIRNLAGTKTIIMIAHRLTTVRDCDVIYMLEEGRIAACGTYDSLLRENAAFRGFAKV